MSEDLEAQGASDTGSGRLAGKRGILIVLVLVVGGSLLGYWLYQRATHVFSDDARIAASMIDVSSRIGGWLVEFPVTTGDTLGPGDLIAVIDSRETALAHRQMESRLAALDAGLERGRAEMGMVQQQTSGNYQAAQSQLDAAEAALASSEADLEFKTSEWQRSQSLRKKQIISQQDWETARNAYRRSQQGAEAAAAQVASARARLVEAEAARARIAVLESELLTLQHERDSLALEVEQKRVNLADHRVLASGAGIVDKTFVNSGEYIVPGQRLLLMHNPKRIWVDANIKETEVRHLAPGQRVVVSVDAYPGEVFEGRVERIGHAATSQFSLLPSANPSGNFTKVTQRLPVRIGLEQRQGMLKPGMMVEVAIEL